MEPNYGYAQTVARSTGAAESPFPAPPLPHRLPFGSFFLLLGIIPAPIGENRAIAEFYNFSPSEPPQFFNIHD